MRPVSLPKAWAMNAAFCSYGRAPLGWVNPNAVKTLSTLAPGIPNTWVPRASGPSPENSTFSIGLSFSRVSGAVWVAAGRAVDPLISVCVVGPVRSRCHGWGPEWFAPVTTGLVWFCSILFLGLSRRWG